MHASLEELKKQRELIQSHLKWLESEIEKAEPGDSEVSAKETTATTKAITAPSPQPSETSTASNPSSTPKATSSIPPNPTPSLDMPNPQSSVQGDIKKLQIGCGILFILGTALILFWLFGLPFFIYD